MSTILVIDDVQFCRDMAAKALGRAGYAVVAVGSAMEGLTALWNQRIDLIVLDNEMPQMPGIEFLRQLRLSALWKDLPVIMLTGSAEREKVLAAREFGAAEYVLKSSSAVGTLLARVKKRLEPLALPAETVAGEPESGPPANAGQISAAVPTAPDAGVAPAGTPAAAPRPAGSEATTRDELFKAIDALAGKTLRGVVTQIISLASSPRGGLTDLVRVVRQDPLISARVFQAANSAAFVSNKGRVASIDEAIRNIGAGTVRTLAMSIGVFDAFPAGRADGADLLRCWQHAIAVAWVMDRLVPASPTAEPGIAYLVGLCHDLDELLLRQRFPETYATAVARATSLGISVRETFPDLFGLDKAGMVGRLLSVLAMPDAVAKPIQAYASNTPAACDAHPNPLVRGLQVANYLANALQLTSSQAMIAPVKARSLHQLSPQSLDLIAMRGEVLSSMTVLARLSPSEEAELFTPLLPQSPTQAWYCRQEGLSPTDPLETALRMLCRVEVHDHLPTRRGELGGCDTLVAAAGQSDAAQYAPSELAKLCRTNGKRCILLSPQGGAAQQIPGEVELLVYPCPLASLGGALKAARAAAA